MAHDIRLSEFGDGRIRSTLEELRKMMDSLEEVTLQEGLLHAQLGTDLTRTMIAVTQGYSLE